MFLARVPKPDPVSGLMTQVVERTEAIAPDGGQFLLPPEDRRRALVERHGLADPGPFTRMPPADADWTPPRPISRREIHAVLREALAASLRLPRRRFALRMTAKVSSLYSRMR